MNSGKSKNIIIIVTLVLVNIIIYFNGINNDFVWDDTWYILDNQPIKEPVNVENIIKLLTIEDEKPAEEGGAGYFRPIINLTLMLDYNMYKLKPYGYRLTNIFLSILCSIALFYLAMLITKNRLLSFIAALIFSAQAVHVEGVTWISARNGVFCTLFILLSVYYYIKSANLNKRSYFFYSLFFMFTAVTAKEFAFMVPFIFILYDLSFDESFTIKKNISKYIAAFSIILLFVICKSLVSPLTHSFTLETPTLFQRVIASYPIMVKYMINQIVPHKLSIYSNHHLVEKFYDPKVAFSFLFIIGLMIIVFMYRKKDKVIFFSFYSYLALLFPVYNIIKVPTIALMADRWLYPASFAFALLLSHLLFLLLKGKGRLISAVVIVFVIFLSLFTIQRNYVFKNNYTLFADAVKKNPTSEMVRVNLGLPLLAMKKYDEAELQFLEALKYNPKHYISHINLGIIYGSKGEYQKALNIFKKADTLDPDNPYTYFNLAITYGSIGQYETSNSYCRLAISLLPDLFPAYFLLADNYYDQGKYYKSIEVLSQVSKISYNKSDKIIAERKIKVLNDRLKSGNRSAAPSFRP
jgi:tetratricopeptide (TPR) repeat protein